MRTRFFFVALFLTATTPLGATPPGEDSRPNIVYILLDDLDFVTTRSHLAEVMPFTMERVRDGVEFTAARSAAICCEARAAILTGLYQQNNGVFTNGGDFGGYAAFRAPLN